MKVSWRGIAVAMVVAVPVGAQEDEAAAPITAVRAGGTVVVCRHAATTSFREREPVDYDDPSTQRRLSLAGEQQSRQLGRAMKALGIEVTELVASPMQRARRTAELMFGRSPAIDSSWHTNGSDYGGPARARRLERLRTPPAAPAGTVLIVSHIGTMGSVLTLEGHRVREGDCVVVRPSGDDFTMLGVVPHEGWAAAGGAPPAA